MSSQLGTRGRQRRHLPVSNWCIVSCVACDLALHSPFPPQRPEAHDPDGLGTFANALALELGASQGEISTADVARAWATAFGWRETSDGWYCPEHAGRE